MRKYIFAAAALTASVWYGVEAQAQMTNTAQSSHAVMTGVPLSSVQWTDGFWAQRFGVFSQTSVKSMWQTWQTKEGKGYTNFLIAAGEQQGEHHGPPFHDGDMYKWIEAVASVYAVTHDAELADIMDRFISLVVKAQRSDGYIHTPVIIKERNKAAAMNDAKADGVVGTATGTKNDNAFENRLNFETYNLGHLIMAGIIHKRATGKTTLFNAAVKAADFLYDFCQRAPEELAGNAICPSHYMGVAELYRETHNTKYLELLKKFIDIRGMVKNGTDDNQDRIPFRQQYKAMGHAVRANYLYAGVADLYIESGEQQLMNNLTSIWQDITQRKMYINGACGALYDGTSPDGTNYTPDSIQKVHQSYGRPYQLPHSTAHNETCANIGNMLFNWRMLLATGEARYADIVENCMYNSILPGISLDGENYFYTNPLRLADELPYKLRWPKQRQKYISCFCCPPNTLRTLCQAQDYIYSLAKGRIYVNMMGASTLNTAVEGVGNITLTQTTDYPWEGQMTMTIDDIKAKKNTQMEIALRIPAFAEGALLKVNGQEVPTDTDRGYIVVKRTWKKGDKMTFEVPMNTVIMEANPLVEENRGQVAVMRGPILYCLESNDLGQTDIDDIVMPLNAQFSTVDTKIAGCRVKALETEAYVRGADEWRSQLYRPAAVYKEKRKVRLIPYFAWGNRGHSEMTVWMPAAY
jgi:hypothetical protein